MNKASIYETKNRLSQIVSAAEKGEPQIITKNGVETAVVISIEEYKKLTAKKQSLVEFLLDNPFRGIEDFKLERDKSLPRPTIDFSEDE